MALPGVTVKKLRVKQKLKVLCGMYHDILLCDS